MQKKILIALVASVICLLISRIVLEMARHQLRGAPSIWLENIENDIAKDWNKFRQLPARVQVGISIVMTIIVIVFLPIILWFWAIGIIGTTLYLFFPELGLWNYGVGWAVAGFAYHVGWPIFKRGFERLVRPSPIISVPEAQRRAIP